MQMYYNYHAKLKKLLKEEKYEVVRDKKPFVFRFNFESGKSMPIRQHRVEEYMDYIK